ncbi:MAG: hypothetical protein COB38_00215 [Gammaproteobacteria bacterium]|nr:MAG: hypothetical protein COB38_00215 [Gammaproteobacteria bacterium]
MIDLWLAIALSAVLVITTIYYSVQQTILSIVEADSANHKEDTKGHNKQLLLFPIIFLLLSIILYSQNPTVELHENWLNTQIETKNSFQVSAENLLSNNGKLSEPNKNEIGIQSMLLGLRTLAYKDSDNADLWFMLAESYFQLSMVELADESMKRAIRLKPSANWYVAYAQILALRSSESDLGRAIGFLRSAIQLEPNHQSAMLTLGFLYVRQQQNMQAIEIWKFLADQMDENGGDSTKIREQIKSILEKLEVKSSEK